MKARSNHLSNVIVPIALAVSLLLVIGCDMREKTTEANAEPVGEIIATTVDDDNRVIISLVAMNQEEIALSQLALQKSSHQDVTALARMLEEAHTRTLAELNKLAEDQELTIPTTLNEKAEESKTTLNKQSGKEFDLAYCQMMVEGHNRSIAILEGAAENAQSADLRGWAERTLPHLRQHLEEAKACQKKCEAA